MLGPFTDLPLSLFGFELLVPAYALQLILSVVLGLIVGIEREVRGKPASLRTFSTISAGSCLFTMLSVRATGVSGAGMSSLDHDVTRVAAQIVTGIGFLGGGVIFKTTDRVEGITTGALIWFMSAVGMACGFNAIPEAVWAFTIMGVSHFFIVILYRIIYLFKRSRLRKAREISRRPTTAED